MTNLPFSIYDFFAHLAAGFLTVVVGLWVFLPKAAPHDDPSLLWWVATIVIGYVIGHVISHFSSVVLEAGLARKLLGRPEVLLFRSEQPRRARLFPGYFAALPSELQSRVLDRADRLAGIKVPGAGLFMHARWRVWKDPRAGERLTQFLNLYGFARNLSFTCVILAGMLGYAAAQGRPVLPAWVIGLTVFVGIVLLYRYLKFYRLYSVEVFMNYMEGE